MALSNAERQARWQAKHRAEHEALRDAYRRLAARLKRENPGGIIRFGRTLADGTRIEVDEYGRVKFIEPKK